MTDNTSRSDRVGVAIDVITRRSSQVARHGIQLHATVDDSIVAAVKAALDATPGSSTTSERLVRIIDLCTIDDAVNHSIATGGFDDYMRYGTWAGMVKDGYPTGDLTDAEHRAQLDIAKDDEAFSLALHAALWLGSLP